MGIMGRRRNNNVTDAQIIELYKSKHGIQRTASVLGIGDQTVRRVLEVHNVPIETRKEYLKRVTLFSPAASREIYRRYKTGLPIRRLRKEFGGTDYAIRQAIKRIGGELRVNPVPTIKHGELDRMKDMHAQGLSQLKISVRINRSQAFVSRWLRKSGLKPQPSGVGRHINGSGYVLVSLAKDDPMASMRLVNGFVLEHRLAMARALNRPLLPTETVHHIDGNRTNNSLANLQLRHGKHGKGTRFVCADCGSSNLRPEAIT